LNWCTFDTHEWLLREGCAYRCVGSEGCSEGAPRGRLLLAVAGIDLAAGNREGARYAHVAAERSARRAGHTSGAGRAWRAVAALAKQDRLDEAARIAFVRASATS